MEEAYLHLEKKKCCLPACTETPKINCIQIHHLHGKNCSTKPPTTGPKTEPPTLEKTIKATAYCWLSDSKISATIPSVTDPPAEEMPPSPLATIIEAKLGARATGRFQMLTRPRLSWRMGHRPNSKHVISKRYETLKSRQRGISTFRPLQLC